MKILMLAAACSPYMGSEPSVGWLWAVAAARKHEVWLVVAPWCMGPLDRAREEGLVPDNLHIIPAGNPDLRPPQNKFLAKWYCWYEYADFQRAARVKARELARQIPFELAHQTTVASWRLGTPLCDLDLPYVWGPLGGGEKFPFQFLGILSASGRFLEVSRLFLSLGARLNPFVRRSAVRAAVVISTNRDTDAAVRGLGRTGPVIRCPMLMKTETFQQLASLPRPVSKDGGLRLFAGGGLDGRKGIALSLRVLRHLKDRGLAFQFTIGGHGSEQYHLQRLARSLDLEREVRFIPGLSGEDYHQQLASTDVILFPSLRDNTALTLVEAMVAGAVPVVLDHGGPGEVVAEGCGFRIPVGNVEATVLLLAQAVEQAAAGGPEVEAMRSRARQRIMDYYLDERAGRTLDEAYSMVNGG